ncbi:pectate lyase-like [Cornus florida]|uniref:pectate lyase-like n=1 Tax=Cornus florida TaxID=4283 RepID=UPI00289F5111|nr:pectate lyase-like [Cornus florida]
MEPVRLSWFFMVSFAIAAMAPTLMANIADFDEVWRRRAEEAGKRAEFYYHPNPAAVANEVNKRVLTALNEEGNNTRKLLTVKSPTSYSTKIVKSPSSYSTKTVKYTGPCKAVNPIDKCFRCRPDWNLDRKRLADCALGFGGSATGGKDGEFYVVTDPSDDNVENPKAGTLRYAVTRKRPLWIIFERSMQIALKQELIFANDKTIDGRGSTIEIANGAGFMLQFVHNIIIHNIRIRDTLSTKGGMVRDSEDHLGLRTMSDGDGISIYGSSNIWIDHVSMRKCADGLIDAIQKSTAITISNCHFTDHNEVMLFGGKDGFTEDKFMQITLAFNHFGKRLKQRMPRVRYGFVHIVNNDYTHWESYALGGSSNPIIISQGNRYIANPNFKVNENPYLVTHRDYASEAEWKNWVWRSQGDVFLHGAKFIESGDPTQALKLLHDNDDHVQPQDGSMVTALTEFAGARSCKKNQPC